MQETFIYGGEVIHLDFDSQELLIYHPLNVQHSYAARKQINAEEPFPFWAKIWPASKALCKFIGEQKAFFKGKNILEVAAGLAIPGLLIAKIAHPKKMIATDYLDCVLPYINRSAALNNVAIETGTYDWENLPAYEDIDVLILSDVNYSPEAFPHVMALIKHFIAQKTTVLLSTPQRLTAVNFIEQIAAYIQLHETYSIDGVNISVLMLHD